MFRRLRVGDSTTELRFELWIHQRDSAIDRLGMPGVVRGIVTESAQRKRVLLEVARIADQRVDEIAGANVVQKIAEETAAERIVTEVLNDAPTVDVGTRFQQLLGRRLRKA